MNKLTNLESYKAYFSGIADKHTDIQFFVYGGIEVYQSELKNKTTYPVLHLEPYDCSFVNNGHDNFYGSKRGSLVIGERHKEGDFAQIDAIEARCEQIVIDIIAKIQAERNEGELYTEFKNWKWSTIDPTFTDRTAGIRLEFEYINSIDMIVNEAKWTI